MAGLARSVSDSDTVRRQNRGLVLETIRRLGPLPRTQLATETGLSPATITAISTDMIGQGLLLDIAEDVRPDGRPRGRPAIAMGFNRNAGFAALIELEVGRARFSLVDYGGTLVDRIESALEPGSFEATTPVDFLIARLGSLHTRNPTELRRLMRIAISVQGILDREGSGLLWSPVPRLAGHDLVEEMTSTFGVPVSLIKRGRLLADGARWLYPELQDKSVATIFVGSTVAMGITLPGRSGQDGGTEFGHMNHLPNGALCRCGMRGCIEAYAADYGVLRAAYAVPEGTAPAPAVPAGEYQSLIGRAQRGERGAVNAFNVAGRAIGFGLGRLLAVFDPSHVVMVGPGAAAFELMRPEISASINQSLTARLRGTPDLLTHHDEGEPIFRGLMMEALHQMDQIDFAALPASPRMAVS